MWGREKDGDEVCEERVRPETVHEPCNETFTRRVWRRELPDATGCGSWWGNDNTKGANEDWKECCPFCPDTIKVHPAALKPLRTRKYPSDVLGVADVAKVTVADPMNNPPVLAHVLETDVPGRDASDWRARPVG